jgi:hypothetical protein
MELFGGELRTIAAAVCTAVDWLTDWAVTRTFPSLADAPDGCTARTGDAFHDHPHDRERIP